jgi:hypothetical protein
MCRLFRELGLYSLAVPLVARAKEHALYLVSSEQAYARLEFLDVSLRFQMVLSNANEIPGADQIAALRLLAHQIVTLNARAREQAEEVLPTALLLAQVNGLLLGYGQAVDVRVQKELNDTLPLLGEQRLKWVQALAGVSPTAKGIETLSAALSKTRYSEDFGTDTKFIAILARRVLSAAAQSGDPGQTLFLLEWLTDLTTNTLESDEFVSSVRVEIADSAVRGHTELITSQSTLIVDQRELDRLHELAEETDPNLHLQHHRYPISADDLTKYAQQASDDELDLHSIGLTGDGSLVRVSFERGTSSVRIESRTVFNPQAYKRWQEIYPHAYIELKLDDPFALNKLEQSLEKIGITAKSSRRPLLFVPDVRLQNIPPNLMLVNGKITGLDLPAATIPSLTWLRGIRSFERVPSGRYKAWIPASESYHDVLFRLYQDLEDVLKAHQFTISSDPVIPADMGGSDVAIIGAHGGLQEGNEWFRAVTDERSTRLSARDVAARVRRCGLVILFVCSGGRVDQHPYSTAGVGLARLLLDYGCRTVIASPWPIYAGMAAYWLPTFLGSFSAGENVITANFIANRRVAEKLSPHPAFSLAMNVFGDPSTRCHTIPENASHGTPGIRAPSTSPG